LISLWHIIHVLFCFAVVFILHLIDSHFYAPIIPPEVPPYVLGLKFLILYFMGLPVVYFARQSSAVKEAQVKETAQDKADIVAILFKLLEEKSQKFAHHSKRVAELTRSLCETMELPGEEVEPIVFAALYHDIGKLITAGPEPHNHEAPGKEQWENDIDKHGEIGEHILKYVHHYPGADLIVRHHHERWDGKGLPEGLQGDAIPLGSRIICVADAMDTLTHGSGPKERLSNREAFDVIRRESERVFDPRIIAVLDKLLFYKK